MSIVASESLVLSDFREFYAALIELVGEVEADPWAASARSLPADVASARQGRVATIQGRLRDLLNRMEAASRQEGGDRAARRFTEASYVMCALADEAFLSLDWEGRQIWAQSLLESRLFGTHVAGEAVFERAELLLRQRDDREMAMVSLLALSLGFEGQHRGRGEAGKAALSDTKARLLSFISGGRDQLASDPPYLFPQAYEHTLEGSGHTKLPKVAQWSLVLAVMLFAYLIVSHALWLDASRELRGLTEDIGEIGAGGSDAP